METIDSQTNEKEYVFMSLRDFWGRNDAATGIAERAEMVTRYKHLRAVKLKLNHKLVERLSKKDLDEGGRRLGILRKGTLVFQSEDESSILMDYCIYDVRRRGRNAVERYLIDTGPDPESDEMVCLRAMQHAVYSLFVVESVERGLGVTVLDLLSNETILIVDMGLGSTAKPGLVFASRVLFHDGFAMTGGAVLPVAVVPEEELQTVKEELSGAVVPDDDGSFDPAPIIRACLGQGSSSHVQYEDPAGSQIGRQPLPSGRRAARAGRNSPCPCGSGRKFKHCCMKRA